MIAVIFEVQPSSDDDKSLYMELGSQLRDELATIEGFISVERFESLSTPGKLLSLSFWHNEAAVAQWRQRPAHRLAQTAGRTGVFDQYRLRVATVVRDYGLHERAQAPADSRQCHATN